MFRSCEHILNHNNRTGLFVSYKILHAYYVVNIAKIQDAKCSICEASNFRQHACLDCVFFGCFRKHQHIHQHAENQNHPLAMDVATGYLHCFRCKDYVYDEEFDDVSRKQKQDAQLNGLKVYFEWEPSKKEIELLQRNKFRTLKVGSLIGLRGLYNMGNTCYMNAVIQVLVHTPMLRNYFFADKHACEVDNNQCWGCIMSSIFQEFYSGCSSPLSLHSLLYILRRDFQTFDSQMQDSEEFYSTILDALHFCESKGNKSLHEGHCNCIIHEIFSGYFETKIACIKCGVSTKNDTSFWDVNLNFAPDQIKNHVEKTSRKAALQAKLNSSIVNDHKEFYQSQLLRPDEKKLCLQNLIESFIGTESLLSQCGECMSEKRTLQVTFKKLPIILSFHLNRKVMMNNGNFLKISSLVAFPEFLDMAPYLTQTDNISNENTGYNLFAVLVHNGNFDGGHNFSYIRMHNSYFKCNDEEVEEVTITEMLDCEGYLLYYHKCVMEFDSVPSEV